MATVNVSALSGSYKYYRSGGELTQDDTGSIAHAGRSGSYNYIWPIDFNLSAHADKLVKKLTLYAKRVDYGSNNIASDRTIRAGLSTAKTPYASVSNGGTDLGNGRAMLDGDTWITWDITGAWSTLKVGTAYIVLSGTADSYTNFGTILSTNVPYIVIEYDEGMVGYQASDGYHRCEVYYKDSNNVVHRVQPYYMTSDGPKQINTNL